MTQEQLTDFVFAEDGVLAKSIPDFEVRPEQRAMAEKIFSAYKEQKIALVEAGTGTGKSIAYLASAIYWALRHGEKTVISTYTIALQEQLIEKDIPSLISAMGAEVEVVLVKGMGNYLCLRKLDEVAQRKKALGDVDPELTALEIWSEKTTDGTKSDVSFSVSSPTWEKINAESYSCNRSKCPHYKKCFFFKAKRKVEEAHILVVNHHLLFSDLAAKMKGQEKTILPSYERLIVDEAHHIEDVARDCLSRTSDRLALIRQLGRLHSEFNPERSRLFQIRQKITDPALIIRLEIELPAQKKELVAAVEKGFNIIETFFGGRSQKRLQENQLVVLRNCGEWTELVKQLRAFVRELFTLHREIEQKKMPELQNDGLELESVYQVLSEHLNTLEHFAEESPRVRWVEKSSSFVPNTFLHDAPLQVGSLLKEQFFSPLTSAILCSATLTTENHFHFIRNQLGLNQEEKKIMEGTYDSPFDYPSRTCFFIPSDIPEPSEVGYQASLVEHISRAICISEGSAFILFTSYEMLEAVYKKMIVQSFPSSINFMKQGDSSRHLLLETFKKKEGNVLFGTDSFWEGVDVPGEALRSVVLTKLPFRVPSDPVVEAKTEELQRAGKDPFKESSIPQAVVKFKQGVGRLMRKKGDRGSILCLDKRLISKNYGKTFLKSLPKMPVEIAPSAALYLRMGEFYKRTKRETEQENKCLIV